MTNKPDSNPTGENKEMMKDNRQVGGDAISIGGNVGVGANIGRGSVKANNIAGGDITVNNGALKKEKAEFADMMVKLRDLIIEAYKSGELNETIAKKALGKLSETAQLVTKEEKPPKSQVIHRLQYVADVLDAAVDMFSSSGAAAKVLTKAVPVAALLIKIATRIF